MNKEIKIKEEAPQGHQVATVETFISQAIQQNVPIETLERLLAMRDKVKAEKAKEAFISAMSKFQADCPVIEKKKSVMNKDGQSVRYKYAPLDTIVSQVKSVLGANGLSYTVDVRQEEAFITAVCKVTHEMGHSETSAFKVPIDTEGYMSAPQKYASALTFAKRYAFCNALGILTGDEDNDAHSDEKKVEKESPVNEKGKIMHLLKLLGVDTSKKDKLPAEILRLSGVELSNDPEVLKEIRTRLEILVKEKKEENENA